MTKFVLETNELTRAEIWKQYLNSDSKYFSNVTISTESGLGKIKHSICVQYAKFLSKKITVQLLTNELGFTFLESKENSTVFINNGYCVVNHGSSFWLSSYDATEGREIKTVEDLVGIGIDVNFKFN